MSLWSEIKASSDRIEKSLSVHERWPGYFNVWVFRGALSIMVLLLFYTAFTYGWDIKPSVYLSCPVNVLGGRCANPYYDPFGGCLYTEDKALCSKEFFFAGETYGVPPSWLHDNFFTIGLLLTALAFGVNHLLYWRRTGQWSYSK